MFSWEIIASTISIHTDRNFFSTSYNCLDLMSSSSRVDLRKCPQLQVTISPECSLIWIRALICYHIVMYQSKKLNILTSFICYSLRAINMVRIAKITRYSFMNYKMLTYEFMVDFLSFLECSGGDTWSFGKGPGEAAWVKGKARHGRIC